MKDLIVFNKPKSPISEAYRSIRTNIQFANIDRNIKSIIVTSATKSEGKTTTLSNLAVTMADMGKKVIVVDCDLRRPKIHKTFDLTNIGGISDILLNSANYIDYIKTTDIKNLEILTAGQIPSNPSEMISSKSMRKLLEQIKGDYDYMFIDVPPVGVVTDASILATIVDGVILVCASGGVEIELARLAKQTLTNVGANILGVVLNKVNLESKSAYSSHYSYYYEYYGKEEKRSGRKKKRGARGNLELRTVPEND